MNPTFILCYNRRIWILRFCLILLAVEYAVCVPRNPIPRSPISRSRSGEDNKNNNNRHDHDKAVALKIKTPHPDYETLATSLLNNASNRMQKLWNRKRDLFLNLTTKGRGYNVVNEAPLKLSIDNDYRDLVYALAGDLSVIPVAKLESPILRRQVQRLGKLQLYGLEAADYEKARDMLHTMNTFLTKRSVCHFQRTADRNIPTNGCSHGTVSMVPNIVNTMTVAQHYDEIEYYWQKWRQKLAEDDLAKSTFINFVRLLRTAATYNGHITPSRTWYLYYESENFQSELEDIVWEIMPLYREFHAYMRNAVRLYYGNHLTASDGAIPHPVLEQLIHSAWISRTIFRKMVPNPKSPLPNLQPLLDQSTALILNDNATKFFESLGLRQISQAFSDKFLRRMNEEVDSDCQSEVFYFPPFAALRYCPKVEYKKLMQRHGDMAELQYNLYKKDLPFGLDREPCPGFGGALAEAAVLASGTPRHLHNLQLLDNYTLTAEQSMNRLFRMGVHTIFAIPQYFINEKFLVDVMDGRIGSHEYNCGYWRLQYKYAGVVPPSKRNENDFDPDYKFYRGLNPEKPNTRKLISEVLGHQFLRAACLASGQYRAGDPNYPLHNCDFSGSSEAGKLIRDMMQLGATKDWRDIMEMTTGERRLTARGVLEYFAPLYTWLKEQNKAMGLETGWNADLNCSND